MTAPIKFSDVPSELYKVWFDEMAKLRPFVPTLRPLTVAVHQACIEIGRQWRIAQVQK